MHARTALLGWSLEAMEACHKHGRPFIAVVPPEFGPYMEEHKLAYEPWDFSKLNERSTELYERLEERGVQFAVPLYEETVEWSGALNARFQSNPRLFNRSLLFRDKAMMKRKAQIHGLKVGVFEEVENKDDVRKFLKRVNAALLKLDEEPSDPVHVKPFAAAGTVGHRVIRTEADIDKIPDDQFPLLAESNLAGQEFSCEAFVHGGKIKFLNITEYVRLGHSNFIPASPELEEYRPKIVEAMEELIEAFGVENGFLHPEWFISKNGNVKFGEVAARVPGGHIFDLIERAYGFSAYYAMVLASDPDTEQAAFDELFPQPVTGAEGHAGCLMIYPRKQKIEKLDMPDELKNDDYFERHTLFEPAAGKVASREGFGNHYGTVFLFGQDPERMRTLLKRYEEHDFYV
ncbi:MAG: ATP-grasp domain-containing protein [Euryarchaeota archaeon]|nr:ATP-grasp domain-containing protein [Euryarchaeota archaeon]